MGFDYNAYNAARPGTRPAPGTQGVRNKAGFDYNAYNAARPGTNIGNKLANYSGSSCSAGTANSTGNIQRTGNPDQDLKNYAKQMGISVNEAKAILQQTYGEPQKMA